MKKTILAAAISATLIPAISHAKGGDDQVSDAVIAEQRANLAKNTAGTGAGPQAPRDIDAIAGSNERIFSEAPSYKQMNLCNIHFHKSAEHKGGEFTKYAGNGDGKGYGTGYEYSGTLTSAEKKPVSQDICASDHGSLQSGDTIEVTTYTRPLKSSQAQR